MAVQISKCNHRMLPVQKNLSKNNLFTLCICVACIMLNLLPGLASFALGLPFPMDMVGTIAAGAAGGYLPGVFVGFATNIIMSILGCSRWHYAVLNVWMGFFAAWFTKQGWLKKPVGIPGLIIVFTLIDGGIGSLISWCIDGGSNSGNFFRGILYETGFFNRLTAHIVSGMLVALLDKTIAVLLAMLILRLIPRKYYCYFEFTGWRQTPLSKEETEAIGADKSIFHRKSLKTKMLLALGVSLTTVAVVTIVISTRVYYEAIIAERIQTAQGVAEVAAGLLDGDSIDGYLENKGNDAGYRETEQLLKAVLYSATEVIYLYVYQIDEQGSHVVFDFDIAGAPGVEEDEIPAEEIGTVLPIDEGFMDQLPALMAGEKVEPVITDDWYGHLLTVYQPVYDSTGKCVCYVGADVDMSRLAEGERSFVVELICVTMGFFVLICTFFIWLTVYHIIYPIDSIANCVDGFSHVEDTQEQLDENVRKIQNLDIRTDDEIEKLYQSMCQMTLDQTEQVRRVRELAETTAKMQDSIIIIMADMVENRDADTGEHIRRTAEYVRIIAEGLKRKGYYADQIDAQYISNLVRSAPLHDVGKINIPDNVLNKPGKLTDEEYEIMKQHATAGKDIVEKAIEDMECGSYLKEARNMTAYHHERWDGKGYPEGLKGEEIPLSARIMALADVFDALTAPRVYKPAFPMEKALSIIEDCKGAQFDPKCVEAFMDSLPEVQEVLKKYMEEM